MKAEKIRKLSESATLGLIIAVGLAATGVVHTAFKIPGVFWLVTPQPASAIIAVDLLLGLLAVRWLAELTAVIARVRRTHCLNSRPLTLLHSTGAALTGFTGGVLLLWPLPRAWAVFSVILRPSLIPISHIPTWVVGCLLVALRPSKPKNQEAKTAAPAGRVFQATDTLTDDPIKEESEDMLARGWFVKRLYKAIKSLPRPCNRFVLAIDGKWGDGKTSVLNLLAKTISADEEIILVRFNPWLFDDDHAAIQGFFQALDTAITDRFFYPSLAKLVGKYSKALSGSSRSIIEAIVGVESAEGYEATKAKLAAAIGALGKQIVVFIDDVDRLEYHQLVSIFRLVNLLADFQNIVFALAIDRVQVAKTLKDNGRDDVFLEKIVQRTEPLPRISQALLDDFIDKGIGALLEPLNPTPEERADIEKRVGYLYQKNLKPLFPNLRSAKEFLNGLWAHVPLLRGEVNLTDLILLEIIHSRFPTLYSDIWTNRWRYVNPGWSRANRDLVMSLVGTAEREKNLKEAGTYIEALVSGFTHRVAALEVLKSLFPEVDNALHVIGRHSTSERSMREARRLCHPDCLRKAFEQTVQEGELPDARIENLQAKWLKLSPNERTRGIVEDLKALLNERLISDFVERMIDRLEKIPQDLLSPIIRSVAKISGSLSDQESIPFSSETRRARNLALLLLPRLQSRDIGPLVEELLQAPSGLDFSVGILFFLLKDKDREMGFEAVYASVDRQKAIDTFASRVRSRFLDGRLDIFKDSEVKSPIPLLNCWANFCGGSADVKRYLDEVIAPSPESFVSLLRPFSHGDALPFEYASLAKIFDAAQLQAIAIQVRDKLADGDNKDLVEYFLKEYERNEAQRVIAVVNQLSQFERDFLKSFDGKPWLRVENANGLHIKRLLDEGFVERLPLTAEFIVLPDKQFGARLTEKGKKLAAQLPK